MPQYATMEGQTGRHRQFIAMFAVYGDGNTRDPRGNNRLNPTPVAGMHDRRTNCSHYPHEAENIKLKSCSLSSGMQNGNPRCPLASGGSSPTQSANVVLEQSWFQTSDQLHHHFFSATKIQAINHMHDSQGPHQAAWLPADRAGGR